MGFFDAWALMLRKKECYEENKTSVCIYEEGSHFIGSMASIVWYEVSIWLVYIVDLLANFCLEYW